MRQIYSLNHKKEDVIFNTGDEVEVATALRQPVAPESIETAKAFIAHEGARLCARVVGDRARAIVLTGSLSRGEATLKRDGVGWRALGDATFLIVFNRSAKVRTAEIESEVESFLISHGVRCKIVVVTSTASALSNMRPHIYAYELRERGIVVWGDQSVLDLMPQFTAADIPIEDGWWFLCNRIIEQLETAAKADQRHDIDTNVRYRIAKLYLSMAACYLLVIGQYAPSYKDRAQRLRELAAAPIPQPSPIPLQRFSQFVSECTLLKMCGESTGEFGEFPQWRDAVSDAESIWCWTLTRMLGGIPSDTRSTVLSLLAKQQPLLARTKGWVKAAIVHPKVCLRCWFRWARLACIASPRYLIYGAAADLFFNLNESRVTITQNQLVAIMVKLPLTRTKCDHQLSWRSVALMIADNFHGLLESTRS